MENSDKLESNDNENGNKYKQKTTIKEKVISTKTGKYLEKKTMINKTNNEKKGKPCGKENEDKKEKKTRLNHKKREQIWNGKL